MPRETINDTEDRYSEDEDFVNESIQSSLSKREQPSAVPSKNSMLPASLLNGSRVGSERATPERNPAPTEAAGAIYGGVVDLQPKPLAAPSLGSKPAILGSKPNFLAKKRKF